MHPPPDSFPPPWGTWRRWEGPPGVGGQRDKDGWDRCGGEGKGRAKSWKGDWSKVGAVSLTSSSYDTKTQNPVSTPPPPLPRANMALQRGAQSSVELLQWLAWGLGPKNLCSPSLPTPPFPESDPHKTWDCSLGALAFPVISTPTQFLPPSLDLGVWTFGPFPPSGDPDLWAHSLALVEPGDPAFSPSCQASEVLVVGEAPCIPDSGKCLLQLAVGWTPAQAQAWDGEWESDRRILLSSCVHRCH